MRVRERERESGLLWSVAAANSRGLGSWSSWARCGSSPSPKGIKPNRPKDSPLPPPLLSSSPPPSLVPVLFLPGLKAAKCERGRLAATFASGCVRVAKNVGEIKIRLVYTAVPAAHISPWISLVTDLLDKDSLP